jgi:hypothetical protein
MSQGGAIMNLLDLARSAMQPPSPANRAVPGASPSCYWRVEYPDRIAIDVLVTPAATADEIGDIYPGARIEPIAAPPATRNPVDRDIERRRNRALAMLADDPERRIAVVAEAGNPAHATVAVGGVAVGDLEIPADRYDGFALLALLQQWGHA